MLRRFVMPSDFCWKFGYWDEHHAPEEEKSCNSGTNTQMRLPIALL